MQKYDVYQIEKDLKTSLTLLCETVSVNFKLKQVIDFFSSHEWKKMRDNENRYEIVVVYLSQLIGEKNFILYNKGEILHDEDNIFEKMSYDDLNILKFVDNKGKCEYFDNESIDDLITNGELVLRTNDFVMMNIGSTVVINTSKNLKSKII